LILRHKSPFFYFLIPNRLNLNPLDPEVVS